MLTLEIDKDLVQVEGIDVNIMGTAFTDRPHAKIAVYAMRKNDDGCWVTDTYRPIVTIETDLDAEDYYDEWYGFSADTAPGDFPGEVLRFIRPFLYAATVRQAEEALGVTN